MPYPYPARDAHTLTSLTHEPLSLPPYTLNGYQYNLWFIQYTPTLSYAYSNYHTISIHLQLCFVPSGPTLITSTNHLIGIGRALRPPIMLSKPDMSDGYHHQDPTLHSTPPKSPTTMVVLPISHIPLVLIFGILWGHYPSFRSPFSLGTLVLFTFCLPQMGSWWNCMVMAYTILVVYWPGVHNS